MNMGSATNMPDHNMIETLIVWRVLVRGSVKTPEGWPGDFLLNSRGLMCLCPETVKRHVARALQMRRRKEETRDTRPIGH
jgi:hypothetical protein